MKVKGRRFQIAGSASNTVGRELLEYGHAGVAGLADALLRDGASVVVGVGKEPRLNHADSSSPATIFDWTILRRVEEYIQSGGSPTTAGGPLVRTVSSSKTESQIPIARR